MLQYLSCRPEARVVSRRRGHQGPAEPQTCSRRVPETPQCQCQSYIQQRQPDISQQPHTALQRSGVSRTQIGHTHTHINTPSWPSQHLLGTFGTLGFPVNNALTLSLWSRLLIGCSCCNGVIIIDQHYKPVTWKCASSIPPSLSPAELGMLGLWRGERQSSLWIQPVTPDVPLKARHCCSWTDNWIPAARWDFWRLVISFYALIKKQTSVNTLNHWRWWQMMFLTIFSALNSFYEVFL